MKRILWRQTGARAVIGQCVCRWAEVQPQGAGAGAVAFEWRVTRAPDVDRPGICTVRRCALRAIRRVAAAVNNPQKPGKTLEGFLL